MVYPLKRVFTTAVPQVALGTKTKWQGGPSLHHVAPENNVRKKWTRKKSFHPLTPSPSQETVEHRGKAKPGKLFSLQGVLLPSCLLHTTRQRLSPLAAISGVGWRLRISSPAVEIWGLVGWLPLPSEPNKRKRTPPRLVKGTKPLSPMTGQEKCSASDTSAFPAENCSPLSTVMYVV